MTTENIDIRIREDGSRVVTRNINDIANASEAAATAVDLLKRALGLVVGALAIDKIKQYADAWSSATGLIQVATKSHEEAAVVQERLFEAAQHTRTAFGDMTELYARAARSGKELGASQADVIQFTEGVGKALVIQHTSAQQASGALLQLGQLLGTGKVHAQEFNSVNEQLAVVLQTVANHTQGAGGSIAKLRQQMLEGKLTSKQFFDAFLHGSNDLEQDFQKSSRTIGQGLTVLQNAMSKFIGELDHSIGFSAAFGRASDALAGNLNNIKDAIVDVTKVLAAGAAGWLTYTAASAGAATAGRVSAFLAEVDAVARGTVVILGSAEAERQKAIAAREAALADSQVAIAARAAGVAEAQRGVAAAEAATAELVAKQALIDVTRASATANLQAAQANAAQALRSVEAARAAGAQSFALGVLRDATAELVAAEGARSIAMQEFAAVRTVEIANEKVLTAALGEQALAQAALTEATVAGNAAIAASNGRLVASQGAVVAAEAAAAGTTGRLAQIFASLRGLIAPVVEAATALFVAINAHPLVALITALVVATGLLLGFGDKINAGVDSITTLGDVTTVVKNKIGNAFTALGGQLSDFWRDFTNDGQSALGQVTTLTATAANSYAQSFKAAFATTETGWARGVVIIARILDELLGVVFGVAGAISNIFKYVWTVVGNAAKSFISDQLRDFQDLVNTLIDGLNKVRSTKLEHIDVLPKVDPHAFDDIGQGYAEALANGFAKGVNAEGGFMEKAAEGAFKDAQLVAIGRLNSQSGFNPNAHPDLGTHGKPSAPGPDAKEAEKVANELRHLLDLLVPSAGATLELAKAHKVLDEAVKLGLITQQQENAYLAQATEHYRDAIDPIGAISREIDQQTKLLGVSTLARETEGEVMARVKKLHEEGIDLSRGETGALRQEIAARNEYTRVVAQQDAVITDSIGKRRDYAEQVQALQNLVNKPGQSGLSSDDIAENLFKNNQEMLQGTTIAVQATLAQYKRMYDQIKQLQDAKLIDDTTANQLQIQQAELLRQKMLEAVNAAATARLSDGTGTWVDAQIVALSRLTNGFTTFTAGASQALGDFFSNFTQGFADSVGKAVVESDNLNQSLHNVAQQALEGLISQLVKMGIQYVANQALGVTSATTVAAAQTAAVATTTTAQVAGLATTTTAGTAAATETATAWAPAATTASIGSFGYAAVIGLAALAATYFAAKALFGFKDGGYTGGGGVNDIAGVVHGQEFVMTADATSRYRPMLEAMNSGASFMTRSAATAPTNTAGAPRVFVQNNGTPQRYKVEGYDAHEIRLIAEDAVARKAPSAVARDLNNPNGIMSKSVRQNTLTPRRRSGR